MIVLPTFVCLFSFYLFLFYFAFSPNYPFLKQMLKMLNFGPTCTSNVNFEYNDVYNTISYYYYYVVFVVAAATGNDSSISLLVLP